MPGTVGTDRKDNISRYGAPNHRISCRDVLLDRKSPIKSLIITAAYFENVIKRLTYFIPYVPHDNTLNTSFPQALCQTSIFLELHLIRPYPSIITHYATESTQLTHILNCRDNLVCREFASVAEFFKDIWDRRVDTDSFAEGGELGVTRGRDEWVGEDRVRLEVRGDKGCRFRCESSGLVDQLVDNMTAAAQSTKMDLVGITTKGINILLDPLKTKPAVFETKVTRNLRCFASQETQDGDSVPKKDSNFVVVLSGKELLVVVLARSAAILQETTMDEDSHR